MKRVLLASLALISLGCAVGGSKRTVIREATESDPGVVGVSAGEKEMNAAIAQAKATLPEFIKRLAKPKPGERFVIKAGMTTDSGGVEHIWIVDVSFKDGKFNGTLGNEPFEMKALKEGSKVTVAQDIVSDWVIWTGERREGGFTIDVLTKNSPG